MIGLRRVSWFKGIYKRIFDILSIDGRLPDRIFVLSSPEELSINVRDTVMGFSLRRDDEGYLWFRFHPPSPSTFAHELIHLCSKESDIHEEIYGYNLANLIILLAKNNVEIKVNPIRLFEDIVSSKVIVDAINEVFDTDFKDIKEYFIFRGIIPEFIKISYEDDELVYGIDGGYSEKDIVVISLTEIIEEARYEGHVLKVLIELLEGLEG